MENPSLSEYISPFSSRYSSKEMSFLFSFEYRTLLFRKLWIALAKAEKSLGVPITKEQISDLEKNYKKIDLSKIEMYEKKFRHDVMAHIHAFGDLAPRAKPILHLGATSCFVTDNADLIQMKEALSILMEKLNIVLLNLASLAQKHANAPCLSYTHYQIAQPTTIGKRITLWLQDFLIDAIELKRLFHWLPFLGAKGATGTQSSFLLLFEKDSKKVKKLDLLLAQEFGFEKALPISGQTYTRKIDLILLNAFASFAASAHKMATDIRLLAHDKEAFEAFSTSQVGSSAMPYKKNPIYSERISGISRFVLSLAQNPAYTTATQWLERTLDDSSNRRIVNGQAFLAMDSLMNLLNHVTTTLCFDSKKSLEKLKEALPSVSTENILMEAVRKGGNRQDLHEKLKNLSFQAEKKKNPMEFLSKSIAKDKAFFLKEEELKPLYAISSLTGLAKEQTLEFLKEIKLFLKDKKRSVKIPKVEL